MSTSTEKPTALPAAADLPALTIALRVSSLLLVILAAGTAIPVLLFDDGIHRIGFAYLAARWSNPYWQMWDLALAWLAIGHVAAGLWRVSGAAATYSRRLWWRAAGLIVTGAAFALVTVSILTFDPSLV